MRIKVTSATRNMIRSLRADGSAKNDTELVLRAVTAYKVIMDVINSGGRIYAVTRTGEHSETKERLDFI